MWFCKSRKFYYIIIYDCYAYRNSLYNGEFRSDGTGPAVISGLAWIANTCNGGHRTSVNKEFGQYGSIATGAHELGHKYVRLGYSVVCLGLRFIEMQTNS